MISKSLFAKRLLERAMRAFVGAATASISVGVVSTEMSVNSLRALAVGAGAAGVSALLSLVSQFVGDPESASFVK